MTVGAFLGIIVGLALVEFLASWWRDRRRTVVLVFPARIEHRWTLTRDRKKSIYSRIDLTQERRALRALADKTAWLN